MIEHGNDRDDAVTRDVELPAGADEVWETLTEDSRRAAWFGGDTELDVRPGGRGFVTDDDGTRRDLLVHEVEPGRRLSFDWWTESEVPSHVEFVIEPAESGTRVIVTERPLIPTAGTGRPRASMAQSVPGRLAQHLLLARV